MSRFDDDRDGPSSGPRSRLATRREELVDLVRVARQAVDALPPVALVSIALAVAGAVVVASGVIVSELLDQVMDSDEGGHTADERVSEWFEDHRTDPLTASFRVVTRLGDGWFATLVVVVAVVLLVRRRRPGLAALVAVASAGAGLVTMILKDLVGRDRPVEVDHLISASGEAFPSGHSSQAVALYGALAVVVVLTSPSRVVRVTAVAGAAALAVLIGVSRVYLGVHWPSDVLSGWIVGGAWLVVVVALAWVARLADRPRGWWTRSGSG